MSTLYHPRWGGGGGELSAALIWSLLPKQQNTKSYQTSQMCAVLSRITLQQPAVIYTWFNKGKQYTVVCNGAAHWHDTSQITGCRFASICALRWLQGFNELRVELFFFFKQHMFKKKQMWTTSYGRVTCIFISAHRAPDLLLQTSFLSSVI